MMMINKTRKITKEQYERAMANRGYIAKEDEKDIFSESERWGYGVYGDQVAEKDGEYVVNYQIGSTCD
jgi:hypothetical protein